RQPLALGHRADRLALLKAHADEQPPAAHVAPVSLADEHISDRHRLDLPWVEQDYLRGAHIAIGDAPLELGPGLAYAVGAAERVDALPGLDVDHPGFHLTSKLLRGWLRHPSHASNG